MTFSPNGVVYPKVGLEDFLRQAAIDIVKLLKDPPFITTLSLRAGDRTRNFLLDIARILKRTEEISGRMEITNAPPRVIKTKKLNSGNDNLQNSAHPRVADKNEE